MDSSIREARLEVVSKLQTLDELRSAPDQIPAKGQFPAFAVVHMGDGYYESHGMSGTDLRGYHDIEIELHVQRKDQARNYDLIEKLTQKIAEHLTSKMKNAEFTKLYHWERIEYRLRPSIWAGVETMAVFFVLRNTKVSTTIT